MGDESALTTLQHLAGTAGSYEQMTARTALADWYLLREEPLEALRWLEGLADDPNIEPQLHWFIDLPNAAALVRLGETDRAEAIAVKAREGAEQQGGVYDLNGCLCVLAEVRAAQGRWDEATKLLTAALDQSRQFGARYFEGQALYRWGEALLRSGRTGEARAPLSEALPVFTEIGARTYVAACERLLARTEMS
jgi:tetratricopeptide (TPR) repeat protein